MVLKPVINNGRFQLDTNLNWWIILFSADLQVFFRAGGCFGPPIRWTCEPGKTVQRHRGSEFNKNWLTVNVYSDIISNIWVQKSQKQLSTNYPWDDHWKFVTLPQVTETDLKRYLVRCEGRFLVGRVGRLDVSSSWCKRMMWGILWQVYDCGLFMVENDSLW